MMLKLSGHKALSLTPGKISAILVANTGEYFRLIQALKGETEELWLFDDFDQCEVKRNLAWDGDVVLNQQWQEKYIGALLKKLNQDLLAEERTKLTTLVDHLYMVAQEELYQYDLPLVANYNGNLLQLYKSMKIHVAPSKLTKPYDTIATDIRFHIELNDHEVVGLCNVANYLTATEISDLKALIHDANLAVLLVEFSDKRIRPMFGDADVMYIDEDFIDWFL